VESNEVAGGATWRWFWNGVQFVNHADYGREIQSAFYYGTRQDVNPNEAADRLTFSFLDPSIRHGSPVLQFKNQGTTQITRAVPLDWNPSLHGGDQDHPLIWESMVLGKDLTLNFNNLGSVAKYTTHLVLPALQLQSLLDLRRPIQDPGRSERCHARRLSFSERLQLRWLLVLRECRRHNHVGCSPRERHGRLRRRC